MICFFHICHLFRVSLKCTENEQKEVIEILDTLGFFIHGLWLPFLVIAPCDFVCKENEQKCSSISSPTHRPVVRISDRGSATWVSSTSELSRGRHKGRKEQRSGSLAQAHCVCVFGERRRMGEVMDSMLMQRV